MLPFLAADLQHLRTIKQERAMKFAQERGVAEISVVSAQSSDGVHALFRKITATVLGLRLGKADFEQDIIAAQVSPLSCKNSFHRAAKRIFKFVGKINHIKSSQSQPIWFRYKLGPLRCRDNHRYGVSSFNRLKKWPLPYRDRQGLHENCWVPFRN